MRYKPKTYNFDAFEKKLLADKETLREYKALEEEFVLMAEMIRARKRAAKTQKDIAKLMKTTASAISRLESLKGQKNHSPSLATLKKYARAVGCKISIRFISDNAEL